MSIKNSLREIRGKKKEIGNNERKYPEIISGAIYSSVPTKELVTKVGVALTNI
jgi:hypothetical protein